MRDRAFSVGCHAHFSENVPTGRSGFIISKLFNIIMHQSFPVWNWSWWRKTPRDVVFKRIILSRVSYDYAIQLDLALYEWKLWNAFSTQDTRFFVDLNGCHVAFETNDLTDQSTVTDTNQFVHGRSWHLLRHDDWNQQMATIASQNHNLTTSTTSAWHWFELTAVWYASS